MQLKSAPKARNASKAKAAPEAAPVTEAPVITATTEAPVTEANAVTTETTATEAPATVTENTATTPEAATEAAPAPVSKAELRARAQRIYSAFAHGGTSVPVKSLAVFKAYNATGGALTGSPDSLSKRAIGALCVAIAAAGKHLPTDGAKPVTVARKFDKSDGTFAIENGATGNIQAQAIATYNAATEAFTITAKQSAGIISFIGESFLRDNGVLAPITPEAK